MPADPPAARGYFGQVAREITFDAQRDPMFQDDQGNGWVPLATYDERCDEITRLARLVSLAATPGRWDDFLAEIGTDDA